MAKRGGPKNYIPAYEMGKPAKTVTGGVDVPKSKPKKVDLPVSKPSESKQALSKIKSGVKDLAKSVKKSYLAGDIPLTVPRYIKGKIPYSVPWMMKIYVNPSRKPQNLSKGPTSPKKD